MKDSIFRKESGIRASTSFTKKSGGVSKNSATKHDSEELIRRATAELTELFSGIRRGGIDHGELDIELTEKQDEIVILIKKSGDRPLKIPEINIICRWALDMGLLTHTLDGGVEIISKIPRLEDTTVYARVLQLLREGLD